MGSRRKKRYPKIYNLNVTAIASDGKSLGKIDDYVVFVKGAIPGDVVDVQITNKRKAFAEGRVIDYKHYSEDRIEAFCSHFGTCGGCKWQMLPYKKQLEYKQQQVKDQFERIGGFNFPEPEEIIEAKKTKFYRNKLEFTFGNRKWINEGEPEYDKTNRSLDGLGFHVQGMFDRIIDIDKCYLQEEPSNAIRKKIREFTKKDGYEYYNNRTHTGFMRNLIIRTSSLEEAMIIVIVAQNDEEKIQNLMSFINHEFPNLNSLQYIVNTKKNDSYDNLEVICFSGKPYIMEKIHDLKFKIGAKTFFQTNIEQAVKMYEKVFEFAQPEKSEIAYDLYTGTGTIANFVAKHYKKVIGIDNIPDSIENAKLNSENNQIDNTEFFAGDVKDILTKDFFDLHGIPDTLIMDPPRAGVHGDIIEIIKSCLPKKIVYVSCNPATQARDIGLLKDYYDITKVQPLDMFPHTHHLENITVLIKK